MPIGLPLLLPELSPPASRVPSSSTSLGQMESSASSSTKPMSPFRRAFSRPLLLNQDPCPPAPSPSGHGFLPDVMPADVRAELRHGLGRRSDLHAELCADMGLLSETLSRRASRERLIRRQLLGQRIDRNRSLQEVASLDDSRGGLPTTSTSNMSLSATRLPEINTLHDSTSARSLLAKKPSSESQDARVAKDDQQTHNSSYDGGDDGNDEVQ
ncbi:uncharacterized protein LOC113218431, partial [Frankliniella occidentalis]|uniref:Uncharacterized protein LOC113218431 n=1 Tax=Frankliniella occidentalis TaxID=133901 RepID=A0A9C6XCK7_FRAOC